MSQENVEIVRGGYEALNRGDHDGVVAHLAADFEYLATGGHMTGLAGLYRGPDDYRDRFLEQFWAEFDDLHIDIHELIDEDDHVVAALTISGRGKRSGAEVNWDVWQLWRLRDGEAIRGQGFGSREEALEAMHAARAAP